jgi:hypothetical protein
MPKGTASSSLVEPDVRIVLIRLSQKRSAKSMRRLRPLRSTSLPASSLLGAGPTPDRGRLQGYLFPQRVGPVTRDHPVGPPRFLD